MASIDGITGAQTSAQVAGNIDAALDQTVLDVYSQILLRKAQPKLVFLQFARKQEELTATKGDTIKFHRFDPLKPGGRLQEGVDMTSRTLDHSITELKVHEVGNATTITERLTRTSAAPILNQAVTSLSLDYAKVTDTDQVRVLDTVPSVMWANEAASRAALTAGDKMSTLTIRAAVQKLAERNVPKIPLFRVVGEGVERNIEMTGEEAYVCFVSPHQARSLREDPDWLATVRYNHARYIFAGEIGMYEGVIFIQTNHAPRIQQGTGDYYLDNMNYSDAAVVSDVITPDPAPLAGNDVYRAYIIGDYLWGFAEALPAELRQKYDEDFGRKRSLAYYAIQGQGLINEDHGMIIETL